MTAILLIAAFAILAGMKLYGFITWSWWIVSIPVLFPALIVSLITVIIVAGAIGLVALMIGLSATLLFCIIKNTVDGRECCWMNDMFIKRIKITMPCKLCELLNTNKERANDRQD